MSFNAATFLHDMPDWMLKHTARQGGRRQKKRERDWSGYRPMVQPQSDLAMFPWGPGRRVIPLSGPVDRRRERESKPKFRLPPSNLQSNELRYWSGTKLQTSGFRQCRLCGQQGCMPNIWMRHEGSQPFNQETNLSCFKILDLAYKLLLPSKKCVICDAHTGWTKWGVPICRTEKCLKVWIYDSHPMPDALEAAVLEVDRRGLK